MSTVTYIRDRKSRSFISFEPDHKESKYHIRKTRKPTATNFQYPEDYERFLYLYFLKIFEDISDEYEQKIAYLTEILKLDCYFVVSHNGGKLEKLGCANIEFCILRAFVKTFDLGNNSYFEKFVDFINKSYDDKFNPIIVNFHSQIAGDHYTQTQEFVASTVTRFGNICRVLYNSYPLVKIAFKSYDDYIMFKLSSKIEFKHNQTIIKYLRKEIHIVLDLIKSNAMKKFPVWRINSAHSSNMAYTRRMNEEIRDVVRFEEYFYETIDKFI